MLEAERVAWGASGRNGGFVGPGYSAGFEAIARQVGAHEEAGRSGPFIEETEVEMRVEQLDRKLADDG